MLAAGVGPFCVTMTSRGDKGRPASCSFYLQLKKMVEIFIWPSFL